MKTIFLLLFLPFFSTAYPQLPGEKTRDSLLAVIRKLPEDSTRVNAWLAYAGTYHFNDISRAIAPTDSALRLAGKIDWPPGIARAYLEMGRAVGDTGNLVLAGDFFQKALAIDLKIGNQRNIAIDLSFIAMNYNRRSDFPNALKTGLEAVDIAGPLQDDSLMSNLMSNVAITYLDHKNYPKGTEWVLKGKALAEKANAPGEIVDALQHLAYIRFHEQKKPEVKRLLREALTIARKLGVPVTVADVLSQLGEAEIDSPAIALQHLFEARNIFSLVGPKSMRFANNASLLGKVFAGMAYHSSGEKRKALFDSAIANEEKAMRILLPTNNRQYLSDVYNLLSEYESQVGHAKSAYDYDMRSLRIYDSLFSDKQKKELADLQSKHDLEIKDRELRVRKLQATDRERILVAVIVGIGLAGAAIFLLLAFNRQRKRSNTTLLRLNVQLEEANQVKARFFGILSHDLRSPVVRLLRFLRLVKNEPGGMTEPEIEDHQRQITRSAEELLETMETMLLWSKEQMDSFKPDIRLIAVDDLFGYLQKFFAGEGKTTLRFSNPDRLRVSGDENYLRVIMQNLTSNAMKALNGNPGGIIEWKALRKGEHTILSVTDNGPGLDRDKAKALYATPGTDLARSGFGFHLIRDLAKAIQFRISLESPSGGGTTFILENVSRPFLPNANLTA